jgi:FkbM family methyltransferase
MMQHGRVGRSKVKRLFRRILEPEQQVEIVSGLRMQLDLRRSTQDSIFWFYEEVEPALQWAIRTLLPVGGTFCDVGANAGLMGLLAIHERNARVIFIEPHPRLAEDIRRNITLNGFAEKAEVLEWTASDSWGGGELRFHDSNDGAHTVSPVEDFSVACKVRKQRLGDFLVSKDITFVDLLKVDAEGHDWNVLKGLDDFLVPSHIEMIFVEMEHCGVFSDDIWNLLRDREYRHFAATTAYIDELRRLTRKHQKGCAITFFDPVSSPSGLNMLWCQRGGPVEEVLVRAHQIASKK